MRTAMWLPLAVCTALVLLIGDTSGMMHTELKPAEHHEDPSHSPCPSGTRARYTSKKWCECKPPKPENYGSLIFVLDITGSMSPELNAVKENIRRIVEANTRFKNYVVALFGDPYKRRMIKSADKKKIWKFLWPVRASHGGDCPEMSLSGVEDAVKASNGKSVMFLFTDASAKDRPWKEAKVLRLLKKRRPEVIVIATGSLCRGSYRQEYHRMIHAAGGGQVISMQKDEIGDVMEYVIKGVKGEVSFKAFPKSASKLRANLEGSCGCRTVKTRHCIPSKRTPKKPKCPRGFKTKVTTQKTCSCKPIRPDNYGSLIFVVDKTRSMQAEIDVVKDNIKSIVEANKRFSNYVIATFGDPYVRNVVKSDNKEVLWNALDSIFARGGGDCPEFSLSGVLDGARAADRNSVLFLFTDATAKDYSSKLQQAKATLVKRHVQIITIVTGNLCKKYHDKYHGEYETLAKATGGQVARLRRGELNDVMEFVLKGVRGEISFKAFPSSAESLKKALKGSCECRVEKTSRCVPSKAVRITCPKDHTEKGKCHDGKRTDKRYTYKLSKRICVKETKVEVRYKGCEHTKCKEPSVKWSACSRGWKVKTQYRYTYSHGLRKCVGKAHKSGRVRCRMPCPFFEKVVHKSGCSRYKGKFYRTVTYITNARYHVYLCKRTKKTKRVACILTRCPKSKIVRGVCQVEKTRGHKHNKKHDAHIFSHASAVYTHDTHVYYVRNSKARCVKKKRVQRRLCSSKMCRCFAIGDPHYKTFDRTRIDFYGGCKYVLSETVSTNGECSFRIAGKNWYHGGKHMKQGSSATKYIEITIGGHTYVLGQKRLLFVDGNPALVPHKIDNGMGFIFYSGRAIEFVSEKCGINVYWDGRSSAGVQINRAKYGSRVRGLCGNCDGDASNDMTDAAGIVYKDRSYKNVQKFAMSYLVKEKSITGEEEECGGNEGPPEISIDIEKKYSEKEWCGIISKTSGPFSKCLSSSKISFDFYFRSCVLDLSLLEERQTELKETYCGIIKAVNEDCAEIGFTGIDWRKHTDCTPKCPANSRYTTKMNPCPATCESAVFKTEKQCFKLPSREGCECKSGYVLDGQRCVRMGECSCLSCSDAAPQEQCERWKKQGHCKSLFDASGMLMACRKTCGYCHEKPVCEDYIASCVCAKAKASGNCSKSFYKHFCGLTCNWRSCPCRKAKTVKGKCEKDGTRTVTRYRFKRGADRQCVLDRVERRESCRLCVSSIRREWGKCNYCTGKRTGMKIETYRSGIRCLKRKSQIYMPCSLCKFPNGKSKLVTDRFCKGDTITFSYKLKVQTGCYECKTESSFSTEAVKCRKRPRVSTTPVRGTKKEKLKICKFNLENCECAESCRVIEQPTECKEQSLKKKRCVIRRRTPVWKMSIQYEKLERVNQLYTRCVRAMRVEFKKIVCPKRMKSITVRSKNCKLSQRLTYYKVNSKCACKKVVKYRSKGFYCCPKPKSKKGSCSIIRGVNVMRTVSTTFYKLVKGMCIKQNSGTRLQVCLCRPKRFKRECQFGKLSKRHMKCRLARGARGTYCKCTQEKVVIPVTCRSTSTKKLSGCTIRKGLNRYMKVRYFYYTKKFCKCVKKHRDRLVWCGCQGKQMYEVKPCPSKCKDPRRCSNRCVKQHIRYVGVMRVRNKRKVCVRKIVSLQKERCCCSPVILDIKPRKKCMPGGLLFKYTYVKKLCRGKRSKLAQCCLVRQATSRRVACKQGVLKTEASRCGSNGYFTISKTIAKLSKCKCTKRVRRSLCRCKCPKTTKRTVCDAGKRIWRVTTVVHKIVNCKCRRRVIAKEFPLDPCKKISRTPSKVGKCNKHGVKRLYYFYSVRSGCKCKKRSKVIACHCSCSSRVSYTRWRCNAKSGVRQRTKRQMVKRGCHCVPKKTVEKKRTKCHRRRKVEKICRRGVLAFFMREYKRRGCRCSWQTTNVVRRRCDPPKPPKVTEKKTCVRGNTLVVVRTRTEWKKRTVRLFDQYYTYYEKVVTKKRNSKTVECKKRTFAPVVRSCKRGKYMKITRYQQVSHCKCKLETRRQFKSCLCRKSMKKESSKCNKKTFSIIHTWKYRKWSASQEGCVWVKKVVSEPVQCSFMNKLIRGKCLNGKTYKITTVAQVPDRNNCKCLKLKESRTANCFCKPLIRRKACDKKGSCVRYTYISPMKWNYKKSRCIPFGKTLKRRIVCCCSSKVVKKNYCGHDGHRRINRTWQVYTSKPVPRCIRKRRLVKLTINCQAAKYQRRLLRKKTSRSACGTNNYMIIKSYRLRLNKKRCRCERYVHKRKRCRCRCRRGEKFERSYCKKASNRRVRVYSRMILKNCGCIKKLIKRDSNIRCRRKPLSSKWSTCNKKTCKQYRIDQVERPKNCKCHEFTRRRLNVQRRCCCNKKTTSDSVCTKMGWKVTTVYHNFDRKTRRCARKIRKNVVQDDDLINCKNNPRQSRVKAKNCALIIYRNRYWIDFRKCTCRSKSTPVKAGKWCCSKVPKVKRHCKNRTYVFVKTVQKLKGMKCVNKYTYKKKTVPCKRQKNIRGRCNETTGWATDYISEARVMLNCSCKKTRVPKKRRCACPKAKYVTDCLKNAGIVRRIKIIYILRSGRCISKRKVVSQTKVCTQKPVLHHSSKCLSNNYITDTYKAQKRVGCRCSTRYFTKQRLCRCDPLRGKKEICKGRYLMIHHYMYFVNKKSTKCNKKVILRKKRHIKCRSETRVGKCEPSGMKGRMVQKIEKVIRHIKKCKCKTKRVIESTKICTCPDAFKKKATCNRETERRKIVHFTFTLNTKHTKCRRHQRISHEVCFCNKRARKTVKCDRRSGNKLVISTWRQFDSSRKACVRKRKTDIREVYCEEKTTRTKTDCTASGVRTDIIKKYYKDFNTCSCRESPRPVKIICDCVPECHKKVVRCVGGQLVTKQKCLRLKTVSPFVNKCVPYYLQKVNSIKCTKAVRYQKFASCNKCWKTFHKYVYRNIGCKCKRVKKFWKKVRCCCPRGSCRKTCEMKGTAKVRRCTSFKLLNGSCVKHVDVKKTPVKCLKRQEFWTKCRKQRVGKRWFRCTVLKSVMRSAVQNCKCQQIGTKVFTRYCCCGPRTVRNRCNSKTGVMTRTITKKILVGEGLCKPVPRVKVIPAPLCRGSFKGENVGSCDMKRNIQKFLIWNVYRKGCRCLKRKSVKSTACGCRRKKPQGPFWTKCVKGVRKVYFYYFSRVKVSQWRYKCVKKRVNHSIVDHCGSCGKPPRTNRVCKGDYWLKITRGWKRQTLTINIPGRYYGSIKVTYRLCVRTKKTKASNSISCADPPEHKAKCNNFRKRIYRYYYQVRKCSCRLKRSLVTVRACMCHKKNYSKVRCNPRTNQMVTSNYIYTARNRVCVKKRHDVYRKTFCNVGKIRRDKTVTDCKNGRRKGLSKFKKVRYFMFYYSNCKCRKRFIFKWKLCGCKSKRKREVCRNGRWYSTLYSVTPRFDRNACVVTKRFVNRDVSCSRNAQLKRLSSCNTSCIRKYSVVFRRLDKRTCRCRFAQPIILTQVCGCSKCPKIGKSKITKKTKCSASEGIKIFTTIKKVFVHNGNLFNRWDITLPKYKCSREVTRKKHKIVCSKGSTVTKEECKGAMRTLTVKKQMRVGCRCQVKFDKVPGGRCKCKGKKPRPPKVWKSDDCSKSPFKRRVTIYSYKLDKSNPKKWKCKETSKVIKRRCGCPKAVKHSAYCNGKGSIIHKKTWKQFVPRLRSCEWKTDTTKKAASCSKTQLTQNGMAPRKTACNTASGFLVTYVKKWYEVDPRDCKCKLKTKRWRCPCRCAHKNHVVNKKCVDGHIITYTTVNYKKKGCKCMKTTRGRKKYVSCRHKREDSPDRIVVGKCQRKGPSRNAGYVRVVYEKEYARRCACKVTRRKRWEPCDCSLIPQYKARIRLACHKSGAFFNRISTYYVVQTTKLGTAFCERRRRVTVVRINKCFDRRGRPLRRSVSSGFDKCSRKRTGCSYKQLIQQSVVRKCKCKWRTIEVIGKKCCCNRPTVKQLCLHNDTKVKVTIYYILDGSGHCVKKTKKQKYKLEKKKACKYKCGFTARCHKGRNISIFRKYYPAKFRFVNCKCVLFYRDIRVPCRCLPKRIVKKIRCDAKANRWVHEVVIRSLRGKKERTRCVSKSRFSYSKTCTRRQPRVTMGRCNKSKVRLRTTHYEVKKNCLCVRKKRLETISCKCRGKNWWVSKESLCKVHKNGYSYYPKILMGYRYVEKDNRCVVATLKTRHVICGCPKPMKSKRCVRNEWRIKEIHYRISRSKNTCTRVERRRRQPMTECSTKKVREEESSSVDLRTGYKTTIYSVVVNKGCKCVKYKEKVVIEWICEVIMKSKITESQRCTKGVIYQKRAGTPYFNQLDKCAVDYSIVKIDVTSYCPKAGKTRRKVVGKCSSKTGRQKVQYSTWKPNYAKCTCERIVKIENEICDCEPIHNRYKKRGCRNHRIKYVATYIWRLANDVCVKSRERVEKEVTCKVGRFKKESQCDALTRRKDITIIQRKLRNCSCKESVKSYKCMCKCKKDRMTKTCDSRTGYTIITKIRYDLKQCACKKRVSRMKLKPPPPCGKKTTKKEQCRRSVSGGSAVSGYQKVTKCKAKRRGCKCRLVCRSRKRLCYCSPDVRVRKVCVGHTQIRVSTLKYSANYQRNRCEWKEVSKVTVNKDCYAMVEIPDSKQCNKKNGVLIIKHWRYQPINCKCKKRVYKITKGRCKCSSVWRKVSEGQCDTTDSCTKPVVYERQELHGIRCIKKRKTDYVTCSCDCKSIVPPARKCERSSGTWVTSSVAWKLRCSRTTGSCKCERSVSKKRTKPKCNGKQQLPFCNKRTRRVVVRYREERLSRSKCSCYWTVVKTKRGFCHCRRPEVRRSCEAHKYRVKLTTITETLDEKRWKCVRSRVSTHEPVRPSCKPSKSVKFIACNALKDRNEWKIVTVRTLHPKSCKCIRTVYRYPQVCMCKNLPARQLYSRKCQRKTGRIIEIYRSRRLQTSKNGKKSCNIVIRTVVHPVICGDKRWRYVGSPVCNMLAKNGCDSHRRYTRKVRVGCACKMETKRKPCKCCCPKPKKIRTCSADGQRYLFSKHIFEKRNCKCVKSTRRWSVPIECSQATTRRKKCLKNGKEKIETSVVRVVNCACKKFTRVSWCQCRCPKPIRENRCDAEKRQKVTSFVRFRLKGCKCQFKQDVQRRTVNCKSGGRKKYRKVGKCNMTTRMQMYEYQLLKFDEVNCECKKNTMRIYKPCKCNKTEKKVIQPCNRACRKVVQYTRFRIVKSKCQRRTFKFPQICCCRGKRYSIKKCDVKKGMQITIDRWEKMEYDENNEAECNWKEKVRRTPILGCNRKKITYKDAKCVKGKYIRSYYQKVIRAKKGKKGSYCQCVKKRVRTVTRYCKCPHSHHSGSKCRNDNVLVSSKTMYILEDGKCRKYTNRQEKVLVCAKSLKRRYKWSKCDRRTCKQKKYGTLCSYKNCKIDVRVDYRNPKVYDCCCPSSKVQIKFLECQDKQKRRVFRKFWQEFFPKRMVCKTYAKNIYKPVECGGWKARKVFPGSCRISGADKHFYQKVRIRYDEYEDGCTCRQKTVIPLRLCKCRNHHVVKVCRRDGVLQHKKMSYRLVVKKGKRACKPFVAKHWEYKPPCVPASKAKWKKRVSKCVDGIKVVTDYRRVRVGCKCKKQKRVTTVICGCSKTVRERKRCQRGRWVITIYGKKLSCRSASFCSCVPYQKTTRKLPSCPKGSVNKGKCVRGFRKVQARLYTIKKCQCTLREFSRHRRCPDSCQDLISTRTCRKLMKEGLCEHPQRKGTVGQICARTCGKCFKCASPNTVKYHMFTGFSLKSDTLYSKRFYIKTIRKTKVSHCMMACKRDQSCNSFDFDSGSKTCVLNTVSKFSFRDRISTFKKAKHVVDVSIVHFVKYCKHKCRCGTFTPMGKCVCEGKGILRRCYKQFSLREFYNKPDGTCALRTRVSRMKADCENPCVDQIETKVCRSEKQAGRCLKDRETRILCNKTCSRCACNKQYTVNVPCQRAKGAVGAKRRQFERKIMQVRYKRAKCGICTTSYKVRREKCKPPACFEQSIRVVGDCIAGSRLVVTYAIELTDTAQCKRKKISEIKYGCKGVCNTVSKQVSKCRFHKKEKKYYRTVMSSFWVSSGTKPRELAFTRKYMCDPSVCPKEVTFNGPCLLGNRFRYRVYYVLDYKERCTKFVNARGESCSGGKSKRCINILPRKKCAEVKKKGYCLRHNGPSRLCMKTCGLCKSHRVKTDKKKKKKTTKKKTKLDKTKMKEAYDIINGISSRYGGRYLQKVTWATIALSDTDEGKEFIKKSFKISGKSKINPPNKSKAIEDRIHTVIHEIEEGVHGKTGGSKLHKKKRNVKKITKSTSGGAQSSEIKTIDTTHIIERGSGQKGVVSTVGKTTDKKKVVHKKKKHGGKKTHRTRKTKTTGDGGSEETITETTTTESGGHGSKVKSSGKITTHKQKHPSNGQSSGETQTETQTETIELPEIKTEVKTENIPEITTKVVPSTSSEEQVITTVSEDDGSGKVKVTRHEKNTKDGKNSEKHSTKILSGAAKELKAYGAGFSTGGNSNSFKVSTSSSGGDSGSSSESSTSFFGVGASGHGSVKGGAHGSGGSFSFSSSSSSGGHGVSGGSSSQVITSSPEETVVTSTSEDDGSGKVKVTRNVTHMKNGKKDSRTSSKVMKSGSDKSFMMEDSDALGMSGFM